MDNRQQESKIQENEKDKSQKHALRNALIVIIVCAVVVIILLAVLLPRRGNAVSDGYEGSEDGWLTATETIYDDSEVTGYVEYIYDDNELLSKQIWYEAPEGLATGEQTVYTYD